MSAPKLDEDARLLRPIGRLRLPLGVLAMGWTPGDRVSGVPESDARGFLVAGTRRGDDSSLDFVRSDPGDASVLAVALPLPRKRLPVLLEAWEKLVPPKLLVVLERTGPRDPGIADYATIRSLPPDLPVAARIEVRPEDDATRGLEGALRRLVAEGDLAAETEGSAQASLPRRDDAGDRPGVANGEERAPWSRPLGGAALLISQWDARSSEAGHGRAEHRGDGRSA